MVLQGRVKAKVSKLYSLKDQGRHIKSGEQAQCKWATTFFVHSESTTNSLNLHVNLYLLLINFVAGP